MPGSGVTSALGESLFHVSILAAARAESAGDIAQAITTDIRRACDTLVWSAEVYMLNSNCPLSESSSVRCA